jgi:hypothetical protein
MEIFGIKTQTLKNRMTLNMILLEKEIKEELKL